jgi:hypothetical protein
MAIVAGWLASCSVSQYYQLASLRWPAQPNGQPKYISPISLGNDGVANVSKTAAIVK